MEFVSEKETAILANVFVTVKSSLILGEKHKFEVPEDEGIGTYLDLRGMQLERVI
jgi:hypothetical protein